MDTETKNIDIFPITRGKRALVFLGDFFITFILAVALFTFGIFPLGKMIVGYDALAKNNQANSYKKVQILYENDIMINQGGTVDQNLVYTEGEYIKYLLGENDISKNPFYTFYVDLRGKDVEELNRMNQSFDLNGFFSTEKNSDGTLALKKDYQELFSPILDEKNAFSNAGRVAYDSFTENYFLPFYSSIYEYLENSDEIKEDDPLYQYRVYSQAIRHDTNVQDNTISICSLISYLLMVIILMLIVPLGSKTGKTLGMMAMHVVRIGKNTLAIIPKKELLIRLIYSLIENIAMVLLIPFTAATFVYLFNLPYVLIMTITGLVYVLVSAFFLVFSNFQQTLTDTLTHSIIISDSAYDEITRARSVEHARTSTE